MARDRIPIDSPAGAHGRGDIGAASGVDRRPRAHRPGLGVCDPSPDDPLTKRELEVLEMMAEGATNPEIADRLVITVSTVKTHVRNILRKLHVRNRTEAVAQYLRG